MATEQQIEAGAEVAYRNNRAGSVKWLDLPEQYKLDWRAKVRPVIDAALQAANPAEKK